MPASFSSTTSSSLQSLSSKEEVSSVETAQPTVPCVRPQPEPETLVISEAAPSPAAASAGSGEDGGSGEKKKKNRCGVCKKKVGLTGFTCRCGGLFCSIHRYSDKHECNFDYKQLGAQEIKKANPVVMAEKVKKI